MKKKVLSIPAEYRELLDILAEIIASDILNKVKRNDKEDSDA